MTAVIDLGQLNHNKIKSISSIKIFYIFRIIFAEDILKYLNLAHHQKLWMTFVKTYLLKVDWSGDWATPWGSAIEERRLRASHPVITPS